MSTRIDIKTKSLLSATLMKTGQTTSYRTGDDGDIEAGRASSFLVLAENNPFGNTNRFTSELGTQTYTNNIVIDWSTFNGSSVLGYRRTLNGVDINWSNAIDGALAVSIGIFTSNWRLPNMVELHNICNYSSTFTYNYIPFNLSTDISFWSSNTYNGATANAFQIDNYAQVLVTSKGSASGRRYIPCRTFTVTGTTLS